MPNGGMPVFTLIATGWRYRKIFFYKKAPNLLFLRTFVTACCRTWLWMTNTIICRASYLCAVVLSTVRRLHNTTSFNQFAVGSRKSLMMMLSWSRPYSLTVPYNNSRNCDQRVFRRTQPTTSAEQVCVQSRQRSCQHDTARICCRTPCCGAVAAGRRRPQLSIDVSSATRRSGYRTTGQTNGRTPDHYIDPAPLRIICGQCHLTSRPQMVQYFLE